MKLEHATLAACLCALALAPLGCDPAVDDASTTAEDGTDVDLDDEDDSESGVEPGGDEDDADDEDDEGTTGEGTASSGDDEGDDEGDEESSTSETGPGPGDGEYAAFAIRYGDIPEPDDGGGSGGDSGGGSGGGTGASSSTTDGGSDIDPDSIQINISTGPESCEDPWALLPCGSHWAVSLMLAPEQQVPGSYDLFTETNGFFTETGEPYAEGDCSFGGGTLEGTVEIDEVNETEIVGRILTDGVFALEEIEFTAPRCAG